MKILSYEEFKEIYKEPKYFNRICFIPECNNLAEYEGGDSRFSCGVCEEHSRIKERYGNLVNKLKKYSYENNPNIDYNKYKF